MRWLALSCFVAAGLSAAHGQGAGSPVPTGLQPGMWTITATVNELTVTGMPEEQAAAMRQSIDPSRPQSQCMTPQQAANPLSSMAEQGTCTFARSVFSGGTIDVAATCRQPNQDEVQITLLGSYTAETITAQYRADGRFTTTGSPQTLHMSVAMNGRRTGHCPETP